MEWKDIQSWHDRDEEAQATQFEGQALAWEYRETCKEWLRNYTRMAKALVAAFGEEVVLDTLEKVWWDLQYEGGKTWREDFDKDLRGAFKDTYNRWHCGGTSLTRGVMDVELEGDRWHLLHLYCKQKEVALEMNSRRIGIGQCMGDCAAVRGWSPDIIMHFPTAQLRGDSYCYQVREIVEDADPIEDEWTKEKSEKYGWRSVKKVEDAIEAKG
jgi:hypothetical protein